MSTISVPELKQDVEELQKLLQMAIRPKVKELLEREINQVSSEIIKRTHQDKSEEVTVSEEKPQIPKPQTHAVYTKQLDSYAWDQSKNYMKIYVTNLPGIQDTPAENVTSEYKSRGFKLQVKEYQGKNLELNVARLHGEIIPEECYHKLKKEMILIMLKKKDETTWPYVTKKEDKKKDKPKMDDTKEPGDSMMDMLKQMYDDGDDEMKRTISKAWHESRSKQAGGDMMM